MDKELREELTRAGDDATLQRAQEKIASLTAQLAEERASNNRLLTQRGRFADLIDELKMSVIALDPLPLEPVKPLDSTRSEVAAVLKCSDWQIGEVISLAETDGFGVFNYAIAEDRVLAQLAPKFINWIQMHRAAGFNIRQLHIFSEGDPLSGNIHKELEITNEFPAPVATVKAAHLFSRLVALLAPFFEEVVVWENDSDNHGRMNPKPQAKQKGANNWGYLFHTIANAELAKHANVRVERSESMKFIANVVGKRFLIQHGDGIKSSLGIPYYGLERDRAREATRRMSLPDKQFDYVSCGHYHVPAIVSGNILINGCLTGTTEFDHSCGRHAEPAQVSFLVHPRWGLFDWTAWRFGRETL